MTTTKLKESLTNYLMPQSMKMYLVGGAVRDQLLGIPVEDRDWVVVGATPEQMSDAGFLPIGDNFPVFLHPETKEEYALARTERKTARGYHGFQFYTDPSVTLEQDLARRDLTINAMAQREDGEIVDPFNGQQDLEQRVLRHVSAAFSEDPVRILRVARFKSRLAQWQFSVAPDTQQLMQSMVESGEVDALVAERVWQETEKTLLSAKPRLYFETLRDCGALAVIFPEFDSLFGIPQPEQWHPEIDTGLHTLMTLDEACKLSNDPVVRFAALCHDIGKADTPEAEWPKHHGHEARGAEKCTILCQRLRAPNTYSNLAVLVARHHTKVHKVLDLDASDLCELLRALDVERKRPRLQQFLLACEADARGRSGFQNRKYPQSHYIQKAADAFTAVDAATIAQKEKNKSLIAEKIHQTRIDVLKTFILQNA